MKNSALVVIDLQNDITKNYKEIIEKVNEAIDWAVQKELCVVYIQHNNLSAGTRTFKPGTHGAEFVPEMKVVSDHIFTKSKSSALTNDEFAAFIKENSIDEFYIAGADAAACIKSTCYIINLFNGSGMGLVNNLCQIVFAIAVGFLLVTIFYRGGSLLPCIIVHSAINTLGTFANDASLTTEMHLLHLAVLIVITVAYTLILTRTLPKAQQAKGIDVDKGERYAN